MIYNKKELRDRVADLDPKENCYVLMWTKDEFETYFGEQQFSKDDWEAVLQSLDTESEEQSVKENIEIELQNLIDEKETA